MSLKEREPYAVFKDNFKTEKIRRPTGPNNKTLVLAYEIYRLPNFPNEHTVINTLKELETEGKAGSCIKGDWLWYYAK